MTRLRPAVAAAIGLMLGCTPPLEVPFDYRAPLLDRVIFGDQASEAGHGLRATGCVVESGGLGLPCRRIGPEGSMAFRLRCDPERQTYLTVRLWGSDRGKGQLYVADGDRRLGAYLSAHPELDVMGGEPAFPGRFFYVTVPVPLDTSRGKEGVTLGLVAVGTPRPYSDDKRPGAMASRSRGIYAACTHTDPFFAPPADEQQGSPPQPKPRPRRPRGASPLEHVRQQADATIAELMAWQKFGPAWDKAVAAGDVPRVMTGCIPPRGAESRKWSGREWRDQVAGRCGRDNLRTMNALAALARAHHSPWSRFHRNDDLIGRVVAGLDYWCRAQGHNGGFVDIWRHQWVGGPERRRAGGCLEGFGIQGIAQAFLLAHREIERTGALDREIDNDDDPNTPALSRRTAYGQLFRKARDYLVSPGGRGHAPNQDLANIIAAWLANDCVDILEPGRAWPHRLALGYARSAVGLEPDPYGGRWVSPDGLAMEPNGSSNGGYCGNYGEGCVAMICRLAQLSGSRSIERRAREAIDAFGWFRYPSLDADGHPCLRKEEIVSWRNNRSPGRVAYGLIPYAALELRYPAAIRLARLYAGHEQAWSIRLDTRNAHIISQLTSTMELLDHYEALAALQRTDYRLPMERRGAAEGWADPMAGAIALRHGGVRLYVALNWRHGFKPGTKTRSPANAVANGLARIHCMTPAIDRIATVAMSSPYGFGKLSLCRYGPYLIIANADPEHACPTPGPLGHGEARDLVYGARLDLSAPIDVPPATAFVIYSPNHD